MQDYERIDDEALDPAREACERFTSTRDERHSTLETVIAGREMLNAIPDPVKRDYERLFPGLDYRGEQAQRNKFCALIAMKMNMRPAEVEELPMVLLSDFVRAIVAERDTREPEAIVINWTIATYPVRVAKLLKIDKRTLLSDRSIQHEQLSPPNGKLYRFDFDAIEKRNPEAAEKLNPDTSA